MYKGLAKNKAAKLSSERWSVEEVVFSVVKRDGHVPTRYGLRLDGNTKIGHFKNELGKLCSLRPNSFRVLCLNRTGQLMVSSFRNF